ncbi:putative 3'-5' exonuclease domain-containing protein [Seiridium unicorne]|uniref:3'-5' exonuclease domain-containing protein n=1 Tax=Seiridium unicorne TaxID=138068 RepID=A0ABR2UZY0_9PEZI
MTTSPPGFQVWHPSRGISFSPGSNKSSAAVYGSRTFSYTTPTLRGQDNDIPSVLNEEAHELDLKQDLTQADDAPAVSAPKEAEVKVESDAPLEPPYPALEYKMSEELFHVARKAAPGAPESYWSCELYRGPGSDGLPRKPRVHYCRSKHITNQVCERYFANEKLLGFDLEWAADSPKSAGPRRNVSLIQLASASRIGLFHVALFAKDNDLVPPMLKKIMEDPETTKVGVWIKGDATRLRTHLGIESKGLVELSHLYRLVTYSRTGEFGNINKRLIPLATQVKEYLHLPMFKGQDVRSSDWTKPLNWEQSIYSASDAYAGVHLYATLEHHRKQLDPCPPTPHHAELNLPIRLSDGLDLETDSEDEISEPPPDGGADVSGILSPAARKRVLKAYLKDCRSATNKLVRTLHETEELLDSVITKDARVRSAEDWARTFIAENYLSAAGNNRLVDTTQMGNRAKFIQLRAYHLWHTNKNLSTEDVAALLRTPPLRPSTVVNYVADAVKLERLPVNDLRFNKEILEKMGGIPSKYRKGSTRDVAA